MECPDGRERRAQIMRRFRFCFVSMHFSPIDAEAIPTRRVFCLAQERFGGKRCSIYGQFHGDNDLDNEYMELGMERFCCSSADFVLH